MADDDLDPHFHAMRSRLRRLVYAEDQALDPDNLWRDDWRFAVRGADGLAADDDPRSVFRFAGAVERTDALAALAEWGTLCPVPSVRAAAALLLGALADNIETGEPLGRALGVEPAGGQTASHGVKLRKRNAILRRLYSSDARLRDMAPRRAAAEIISAFATYSTDAWPRDRRLANPPDDLRHSAFWLLRHLNLKVAVPKIDQLTALLEAA